MDIVKQAQGGQSLPVTAEQLEQINRFARRELKAEELYSFSVRLCDNEVDRDGERLPPRWCRRRSSPGQGSPTAG